MLIVLRFAGVAGQSFGPEVIVKRTDEVFEHGKHCLHPHSEAIQLNRRHRRYLQIVRHQDDGTATGQCKDETNAPTSGFPKEIECQVRHVFEGAIALTWGVLKEMLMIKDLVEFDFVAVESWPTWAGMVGALSREVGHIVLFSSYNQGDQRCLACHGPDRAGQLKDRSDGEKRIQHEEATLALIESKVQCHVDQAHR